MKLLILLSFFAYGQCLSQNLVLINQNGELILNKPLRFEVSVPKESDTIGFSLDKGRVKFKIDPNYNFVKLHVIKDLCIKEYYNEFTEEQFSTLDTLMLFESCIAHEYTPLIQFKDFKGWLKDTLEYKWFSTYLDEIDFDNSNKNIAINVQTTHKNLLFKKMKIKKHKDEIANAFGVSIDRVIINFNEESYVIRDGDLFVSGQKVTKKFIRNQNSPHMKELAKKYSLVGSVGII